MSRKKSLNKKISHLKLKEMENTEKKIPVLLIRKIYNAQNNETGSILSTNLNGMNKNSLEEFLIERGKALYKEKDEDTTFTCFKENKSDVASVVIIRNIKDLEVQTVLINVVND
jgi:hypothetical protein